MKTVKKLPLSNFTSFKCGGYADTSYFINANDDIKQLINTAARPIWILGYGSNSLISDDGLPGTTIIMRGGSIDISSDTTLIVDAGVWWDDLVKHSVNHDLWGLECTSAIPGNVGAAVVGNIAAYGQAVADTLVWADILNINTNEISRMSVHELRLEYRKSVTLQTDRNLVVLKAAFSLSKVSSSQLVYENALNAGREIGADINTLHGRREAIIKAREHAGSLWDYRDDKASKTAGSFFRNPLVDAKQAENIMRYDETGKATELLKKMNLVHGGNASRVSAAHVLLAAGFKRGQTWGPVRLHPHHVLKIENTGSASAQQIFNVAKEIMSTVKIKLNIDIEPEIRYLGRFES